MGSRPSSFSHYPNSPEYEKDKCPAWGMQSRVNDQNNPFLSENLGQPIALVRLQPDETLMGHFKIKCYLGNGSFGSVYLAEDMIRSTEVALKVAEVGPCNENIASLRLQREMNTHSTILDHTHVIRVHDLHFVPWGGIRLLILSMEYADGGTFRDWLSKHIEDLEARRTIGLEYFKQACHGVDAIHDAGAIHLDLKPENLLYIGEVLKVSDLGSSRYAQILNQSSASYWNMSSVEEGTPIYKSPEHFVAPHPDDLDFRADIYSLGIILFELLHPKCRPPFGGSNERLREFHLHVPAPQLREAGEGLAGIVTRCLQKDPDDRYQAVRELLEDLEEGRCSSKVEAFSEDLNNDGATSKTGETWEKASLWFSKGDFNEAARLTGEVLCMEPDHTQALQLKEELRSRFDQAKQFYEEIRKKLDEGVLSGLIELLEAAVKIYPDHPHTSHLCTQQKDR